jgi:GNAT superfamily N-acetyltransferase
MTVGIMLRVMTTVMDRRPTDAPAPDPAWTARIAAASDRDPLERMFDRCSAETVYRRFFGRLREFPRGYLAGAIAGDPGRHDAVVVRLTSNGAAVALASLVGDPEDPEQAELAVLVEDAWQRRGVGAAMVEILLRRARARGVKRIVVSVLPGRTDLLQALRRLPLCWLERGRDSTTACYLLVPTGDPT